jgi:uncharacterized protein (TIGR01777 family)
MVGSALADYLTSEGDDVHRLVRRNPQQEGEVAWYPDDRSVDPANLEGFDVVYHLAGENIAQGRWTEDKKARIRDSRIVGTGFLCETLAKLEAKPGKIIAASAIGYYGDRGDEILREDSSAGHGFLPDVCEGWEQATLAASGAGIPVVSCRVGIVLDKSGGALAKMLLPFKMGVGGNIGSGTQYMSWITLDDLVSVLHYCAVTEGLTGAVNAVAPNAITNKGFTKALGRALHRPTLFPMPAFAAKVAFGEMADALLLSSTRVEPRRLFESGYEFQHSDIDKALEAVLEK